ncbi:amidase [Nocardioides panacisoli]|uniref:amidase n=1 Tax=Nocardioides panacisoli TaxID=627624 RepID=UPI001C6308D3|nr:amidase [Nocardioides panacisoli]QYJ02875.1 amidase [Nocardioides panacisoli]
MTEDLCLRSATELSAMLRAKEVSAREVLAAHLSRIERINPRINAIVTLTPEEAERRARACDDALAAGEPVGPLHGLPVAHKDLVDTAGIRTTYGSTAYRQHVPTTDHVVAQRVREAGGVLVGKTNTPEWGTGSHTENEVFGLTRNPWDTERTAGGSSGGAAAALAARLVPLADGTDMGGSLRNPASFCNVVGLRPSIGRVPAWPAADAWFTQSVSGPMARTAEDLALYLSVLGLPDARSPLTQSTPVEAFRAPLDRDFSGVRVAWSPDLGGLAVDEDVVAAMAPGRDVLRDLGCEVADRDPDLTDADDVFRTWRAWWYALALGDLYRERPDDFGESAAWNITQGLELTGEQLLDAGRRRTVLYHRLRSFLDEHEFLVTLVSPVTPFPGTQRYPFEVGGRPTETYLDWMRGCYWISATGMPAASVPLAFTPAGLPVGLQVVGRPGDDLGVLQLAHAIEKSTTTGTRVPNLEETR